LRSNSIDSDGGFSLAEILVTIAIVGITFTAILGGIMTSITASALQRKEATADAVVRSAAELVKDSKQNAYVNCAVLSSYPLSALTVPSGFAVNVTNVEYWTGTVAGAPYSPAFQTTCPSADNGMQRITIVATSSDGQVAEKVQVIKRKVP
jgi:prepilin-type N-terminal cleavage/methylation domain-containing protein